MINFFLFFLLTTPFLPSFIEANESLQNTTQANNATSSITKAINKRIEMKHEELKGSCEFLNNKIGALLMKKHNCNSSIIICYKIGQTVQLSRRFKPKSQTDPNVKNMCNGNPGVKISFDIQLVNKQKACCEYRAANGPFLDDFSIATAQDLGTAFVGVKDSVGNVWRFQCGQTPTPVIIQPSTQKLSTSPLKSTESPPSKGTGTNEQTSKSIKSIPTTTTAKSTTTTEAPQENCPQMPCSIKLNKIYPGTKIIINGKLSGEAKIFFVALVHGAPKFNLMVEEEKHPFGQVAFYLEIPSKNTKDKKSLDEKEYSINTWTNLPHLTEKWVNNAVVGPLELLMPEFESEFNLSISFTDSHFVFEINGKNITSYPYKERNVPLYPVSYLYIDQDLELPKQPEFIRLKTHNGMPETNFAMELKRLWPGTMIIIDGQLNKDAKRMVIALNKDRPEPAKKQIVTLEDGVFKKNNKIEVGDSGMIAEFDFSKQVKKRNDSEYKLDVYSATQFLDASHQKVDELYNRNPLKPGDKFVIKIYVTTDHLDGTYYFNLTDGKDKEFARFYTHGPCYKDRIHLETINHIWFGGDMKVTNVDVKYGKPPKNILELSEPLKPNDTIKINGIEQGSSQIIIKLGMNDIQLKVNEHRNETINDGAYALNIVINQVQKKEPHEVKFSSFYYGERVNDEFNGNFDSEDFIMKKKNTIEITINVKQENFLISFSDKSDKPKEFALKHVLPYWAVQYIEVTGLNLEKVKNPIIIEFPKSM